MLDLSHEIWQLLTDDIPELRGDDLVLKLLDASIEENVTTLLHMFELGTAPDEVDARQPRLSTPNASPNAGCRSSH